MKKQKNGKQLKGITVGMVICFVAVIGMAGNAVFKHYKNKADNNRLAKEIEKKTADNKEPSQAADTPKVDAQIESDTLGHDNQETDADDEEKEDNVTPTKGATDSIQFSAENTLMWPVDGNVLLNYSMDSTVYFSTLDQYKYNPALIISGEVGSEVLAADRGIVKSVEVDAQTGTTVTVDMGSGYEARYGQLQEVLLNEGEVVEKGQILGYLAEPTKYYTVEGCNLYFQMLKDGEPVNPLEYMDI